MVRCCQKERVEQGTSYSLKGRTTLNMEIVRPSLLLLCVLLSGPASHALHPGPNVCSRDVQTQATRTTLRYYMCPIQKIRRSYVDTERYTVSTPQLYCCGGYQEQEGRCEPTCAQGCTNGFCSAPGTCQCHPGYTRKSSSECEASCPGGCVHGRCTGPNTCTCAPGYQKRSGGQANECAPVCVTGCVNGACTAPGMCTCSNGYRRVATKGKTRCVPVCTEGCANGVCTAPDTCTCSPRYRLQEGSRSVCAPVCTEWCANGVCTAPDTCTCNHGYEKGTTPRNQSCIPKCSNGCANGVCTAPERCVCDESYVNDGGQCVAEIFEVDPE